MSHTALDPQRRAALQAALNEAAQACPVLHTGADPALRPLMHGRGLPHATTGGADLWPRFACYYERLTHLPRRTRRALQRQWRRSLAALALLLALGQAPALAATIDVDGTTCTLVDAITAANTDAATGGCPAGSGADTLTLQNSSVHTLTSELGITSAITIEGNGSTITRNSGAPDFPVVGVSDTGDLTLNETTVRGGAAFDGGGVLNVGTLTLTNSTVSGSSAYFNGGGIFNFGIATLTDSTVSGNSAAHYRGGGVYNRGILTLTNSTVSGNSAPIGGGVCNDLYGIATLTDSSVSGNSAYSSGGGVYNTGDTMTLTDSTVSGNSGGGINNRRTLTIENTTVSGNSANYGRGGGIYNDGTLTIENSTVSGNSAHYYGGVDNIFNGGGGVINIFGTATLTNSTVSSNSARAGGGGGVLNVYGTVTLSRTLVSGNTAPGGAEVENSRGRYLQGTVTADDFNLFGHSGLNAQAFEGFTPGASDITATSDGTAPTALANILNPLADNGGSTETHALSAGSPAIDAVGSDCPPPATDQRGVARPQGLACDIGSFEVMAAPAPDLAVIKSDSPDPVVVSDHLRYTVTVNNAGQGEATGVILTDTLPASVDFVSVRPNEGCVESGGVLTCELGTLASGERASVQIVVIPTATGKITNRVAVESAETDENPENNTDSEQTTVTKLLCHGRVPTLVGTPENNTLTGTSGPDVIHGLGGHDIIKGRGGKDVLCGGEGNDTLFGENGKDTLFGENGKDTLNGNNGADALDGGTGTDTCNGGNGPDTGINCETVTSIP